MSTSWGRTAVGLLVLLAHTARAAPCPGGPPTSQDPQILYTDVVAGPVSGGENDLGGYISIFGRHFGDARSGLHVYFGAREVAAYRYFGPSKGQPTVQQITVQPGPVGSGSLPIRVEVDGRCSDADRLFFVNPGRVLFVDNIDGDDSHAKYDDIHKPWRHLQTPERGGALRAAHAGDVIVLRGRAVWSDVGFENRWVRIWDESGSPPEGRLGTGYVTIEAYPGEDVHYRAPNSSNGGFQGAVAAKARLAGQYLVISGLRIESVASTASDGAPINLQSSADHWRVVNNDLSWKDADPDSKSGGIAGNCVACELLGNHIHDIGGRTENHGIYLNGSEFGTTGALVAYNWIQRTSGGNGLQSYNGHVGGRNSGNRDLVIHDNLLEEGTRYGINISDATHSAVIYGNTLANFDYAGIRINAAEHDLSLEVHHNEVRNVCRIEVPVSAAIVNTADTPRGSVSVHDNLFVKGPQSTCRQGYASDSEDRAFGFARNQWRGFERSPP